MGPTITKKGNFNIFYNLPKNYFRIEFPFLAIVINNLTKPYLILSNPILSYLTLSYLIQPCLILSYLKYNQSFTYLIANTTKPDAPPRPNLT